MPDPIYVTQVPGPVSYQDLEGKRITVGHKYMIIYNETTVLWLREEGRPGVLTPTLNPGFKMPTAFTLCESVRDFLPNKIKVYLSIYQDEIDLLEYFEEVVWTN